MNTAETVCQIAMALPGVQQRTSYGTPAYFVKRKLFARMLEDDDTVVLKIDPDQRKVWMRGDPQTFFITDHYQNYPMMIVRLSTVDRSDLGELIENAWSHAKS